jgi:hypothetical protein
MERVKGIKPSYSESPDFRNIFKGRSDISQLSGRLRSLRNFSLSEWRLSASLPVVARERGARWPPFPLDRLRQSLP